MVKVVITVPGDFLKEVDQKAKAEHRSRSELVREALREYLASRSSYRREEEIKQAIQDMDRARRRSQGSKIKGSEIIHEWRYRLAK